MPCSPPRNAGRSLPTPPNGTRLSELADAAQMTKQAAGFLVDQLERAGYLERVPDPSHRRARLIRITPCGAQTIPISAKVIADIEAEWTEHVGPENLDHLRKTLAALREITDPYWSPSHLERVTHRALRPTGPR